jgi:hypothetical protein
VSRPELKRWSRSLIQAYVPYAARVGNRLAGRRPREKRASIGLRKGRRIMVNRASAGNRRYLPSSPFKPPPAAPPVEQYALDDLVTHDKYGLGRVILVEGDTAVVVDFTPRKVRIMAPFARMVKL